MTEEELREEMIRDARANNKDLPVYYLKPMPIKQLAAFTHPLYRKYYLEKFKHLSA
jgi:hypothetical protein